MKRYLVYWYDYITQKHYKTEVKATGSYAAMKYIEHDDEMHREVYHVEEIKNETIND